jgi:hypothetical protein
MMSCRRFDVFLPFSAFYLSYAEHGIDLKKRKVCVYPSLSLVYDFFFLW